MRHVCTLCAVSLAVLVAAQQVHTEEVKSYFTGFYWGDSPSTFDESARAMGQEGGILFEMADWAQAALAKVPRINLVPLDLTTSRTGHDRPRPGASSVFIRGVVSRAELKDIEKLTLRDYLFSVTVSLEFFDVVSGEVYYTRALNGFAGLQAGKSEGLTPEQKQSAFRTCLRDAIEGVVRRIGEEYTPGVFDANVVDQLPDSAVLVIDRGRMQGAYPGLSVQLYDGKLDSVRGIATVTATQDGIAQARVVALSARRVRKGWRARAVGINRRGIGGSSSRYAVAGFSVANRDCLDPEFDLDEATLGQWLHDGLAQKTALFMTAPLIATVDSAENLRMQDAVLKAQSEFSISGGESLSALMGRRAFPDILVRGVVTRAEVNRFKTPGAENMIVSVGISVEFYDRKTRDFIHSCQESGRAVEKIVEASGKVYRSVDLQNAFGDACKDAIAGACTRIAAEYDPAPTQATVVSVSDPKRLLVEVENGALASGDMLNLVHPGDKVRGMDGKELERLWQHYGIGRVSRHTGGSKYEVAVVATDGTREPSRGDLLRIDGRNKATPGGKTYRVEGWAVKGNVDGSYHYSLPLLTEWLHNAFVQTGQLRLLPPNYRASDMDAAAAALSLGEFQRVDPRELIYQEDRAPDVCVYGRLGLATIERKEKVTKDRIVLTAGAQVSFVDARSGDTLYTKKLAGTRKLDQIFLDGELMIGGEDFTNDLNGVVKNTLNEIAAMWVNEQSGAKKR